MNEDVELVLWCTPLMLLFGALAFIGLTWFRHFVTGAVKLYNFLEGLL